MILGREYIHEIGDYMNNDLGSTYSEAYSLEWGNHPNILYINYSQHAIGPHGFQYG